MTSIRSTKVAPFLMVLTLGHQEVGLGWHTSMHIDLSRWINLNLTAVSAPTPLR
jgi:hypothetical protein